MDRLSVRRLGLTLICGIAALGLNSVFGSEVTPLLLGRVMTLPIAILFGPSFGVLSTLISGVALAMSTTQTQAVLVFAILEAVLIGAFAKRGKSALITGAIVWTGGALLILIVARLRGVESIRQT